MSVVTHPNSVAQSPPVSQCVLFCFLCLVWQVAAQSLADVADSFHEEGNMIILAAKKMSEQMFQMAEYSHGRGELLVANTLPA